MRTGSDDVTYREAAFSAVLETFDCVIYFETADLFFEKEQTARQHEHFHSFNMYVIKKNYAFSQFLKTLNFRLVRNVSGSPFTVQVKPRQYKPVLSFGRKGSSWSSGKFDDAWGVAVNEGNEIAVTDSSNNWVQIFRCNGKFIGSFGKKGVKKGEFKDPSGIAYLNNGNIVVADTFNDRLQIFTDRGEYLAQIGSEEDHDHQFNSPMGLSVDSNGNIIVADSDNQLIKIFTASGQFLRKFGGEDLLVDPFHCIQKDQYFIVSDTGDDSIKVFNTEGDFLLKLGNEGEGDWEFDSPHCLSVDKAGHTMVSDYGNDIVQVLDLSGKFITKIRVPYGGEIEPFQLPTSTAVLTDGRIVLTDYCNDRMLIIE